MQNHLHSSLVLKYSKVKIVLKNKESKRYLTRPFALNLNLKVDFKLEVKPDLDFV
jgi:hypothetical protein